MGYTTNFANSDMLLWGMCCLVLMGSVRGFNDDRPMSKWSPSYFNYRYFPGSTKQNLGPRDVERQVSSYSTPLGYNPSWFVSSLGTTYKRRPAREDWSSPMSRGIVRGSCVSDGGVCLYRGALIGAAIKLNCCDGAKCVFVGKSFTCVSDSEMESVRDEEE